MFRCRPAIKSSLKHFFSCFRMKNQQKHLSQQKRLKTEKKSFLPALVCMKHMKACQNTQLASQHYIYWLKIEHLL